MKIAILAGFVLVLVIGIFGRTNAAPSLPGIQGNMGDFGPRKIDLKPMFDYFIALLDTFAMTDFVKDKLETDLAAQETLAYLRGPNGIGISTAFWTDLEFLRYVYWLYSNGLTNIYNDFNLAHDFFGWSPVRPPVMNFPVQLLDKDNSKQHTSSLKTLFEEYFELFGYDISRVVNAYIQMLIKGEENAMALLIRTKTPEMKTSWNKFKAVPAMQETLQILRDESIPIDNLIALIEQVLGWSY